MARKQNAFFIFTSSAVVHGIKTPRITSNSPVICDTPYAESKAIAENEIQNILSEYCILRLGGIFWKNGPPHLGLNRAIDDILAAKSPVYVASGSARRNYISVNDAARLIVSICQQRIKDIHLSAGSGAHFDVENRVNQRDDFEHIIRTIYDTHTEFQWVFLGAFPLPLRPLVERGLVEFHPWTNLYNYGEAIYKLRINMMIAPLQDNNFNKSKSDLKWIEANCFGLPIACQDLCTYKDAEFKFKTGEEMIGIVRDVLSRKGRYMNICATARKNADSRWMENSSNLDCYYELFNYPYGAPERVNINRINGITV